MSRLVSRAESWEKVYLAFQNINFAAFDYNTIKQSIIDYIKLYFPETFNDFIESSEFIAIVEAFAYVAELIAYRLDVNAHENFISTAQRRDSILRLAKLVSYSPSRPLPARGLVKITSVQTTEAIVDANGINLAGVQVRWNDSGNPDWKNQFILIMNRVLEQEFGTVRPSDRFQIQDVVFELYSLNLNPLPNGVFSYTASVNGASVPMELVPVAYNSSFGIIERRPVNNANFTLLYGSDGLGDGSDTTGFFCFTKQGTLQKVTSTFDGVTPNQTFDINIANINDIDVWVNNIDPTTGQILDLPLLLPYKRPSNVKTGEWQQVDLAHAQNVIFNTNPNRNKYEIETRDQNTIRIIFGDGEFADIPSGTFDIWFRTSLDENIIIPQAAIANKTASFTYVDSLGQTQTFTFTFSLINSLQNASAAETTERIRTVAPAVYYTQDRMVNAQDYNTFMLQDPSILKLRAINRTFVGDSKYISWHDPRENYDNVKLFGDDGYMYFQSTEISEVTEQEVTNNQLIDLYVEPLLSSTDIVLQLVSNGVDINDVQRTFTSAERTSIITALTSIPPVIVNLYYKKTTNEWFAAVPPATPFGYPSGFILEPLIIIEQTSISQNLYKITRKAKRLIFESPTTRFWNENSGNRVINFDTLNSDLDQIIILQANTNYNRNNVLQQNWNFNILGLETTLSGPETGLPDYQRVSVLPVDQNNDGVPDYLSPTEPIQHKGIADFIHPKLYLTASNPALELPIYYVVGRDDVQIIDTDGSASYSELGAADTISNIVDFNLGTSTYAYLMVKDYVYFSRLTPLDPWVPTFTTYEVISNWLEEELSAISEENRLWKREEGRGTLNFAWFHNTPRYHLIDPAPTNIIDMFIITKGYYESVRRWLQDQTNIVPTPPTPLDLRTSYNYLIDNKMISDTVVLHSGRFKILFGSKAPPELRATLKVIVTPFKTMTDNQIKTTIVTTVRNFFDINSWEFGETFYFTELASAIHSALPTEISSVVLVPTFGNNQFGDLFQIQAREDELFYPDISVEDIQIVTSYTPQNLRLNG